MVRWSPCASAGTVVGERHGIYARSKATNMAIKTTKWDAADHLNTKEDIAHYLDAAFEDGDGAVIRQAFNNVARSKGMTEISRQTGLTREALSGHPTLDTLLTMLKALGLRLAVKEVA